MDPLQPGTDQVGMWVQAQVERGVIGGHLVDPGRLMLLTLLPAGRAEVLGLADPDPWFVATHELLSVEIDDAGDDQFCVVISWRDGQWLRLSCAGTVPSSLRAELARRLTGGAVSKVEVRVVDPAVDGLLAALTQRLADCDTAELLDSDWVAFTWDLVGGDSDLHSALLDACVVRGAPRGMTATALRLAYLAQRLAPSLAAPAQFRLPRQRIGGLRVRQLDGTAHGVLGEWISAHQLACGAGAETEQDWGLALVGLCGAEPALLSEVWTELCLADACLELAELTRQVAATLTQLGFDPHAQGAPVTLRG